MGTGMMDGAGYMGWGGMALGGVMMLFWFALLVGLIVLIVRWLGRTSNRNSNSNALDILKQRFARGEIDAAELEERSRQLGVGN